jgi:hypothetical protein
MNCFVIFIFAKEEGERMHSVEKINSYLPITDWW